jgi:hypothetical protein
MRRNGAFRPLRRGGEAGNQAAGPWRAAVLVASLLVTAGCPTDRDAPAGLPSPDASEPPGTLARERCEAFHTGGLLVEARTREQLRGELGEPLQEAFATEPNRHVADATDTISVIRYRELEAQFRIAMGRDHLESMIVRGNRHLRYGAPAIGTPEARLIGLLGEPARRERDRIEYYCGPEPMPDVPIGFSLENGEVREITFYYYVD